jgi:hypothetical protein
LGGTPETEETERAVAALRQAASFCEVIASALAVMGREEPALLVRLLALFLGLVALDQEKDKS